MLEFALIDWLELPFLLFFWANAEPVIATINPIMNRYFLINKLLEKPRSDSVSGGKL
jgi:hypothetical protein